jgi:plastocyanin
MRRLLAALLAVAALPAGAGEVRGTVRYAGAAPQAAPLEVTKDRSTCGQAVPDESLVVAGGKLAHAVVQLRGVPGPAPAPVTAALDQQGCRFVPRVQALPRGSSLDIVSSDPVLHNVHGWIGRATVFNQAMAVQGQKVGRTLDRPGIIQVKCDVHDWMAAWILVVEGPAAVTGADGSFAIAGVPPGTYTALAWHERLGELTAQVTVPAQGAATLELVYGK